MKQKLQTLFDKNNIKQTLLNTAFILFLLSLLVKLTRLLFSTCGYESWEISEFLINYQGGFVRRGLTGEILFFIANNFNVNVEWTIKIVCLLALVFVCFFFVKQFLKKGYALYILPLCFFLGGGILFNSWVRKDYLFFCFFISVLWLYNKNNLSFFSKILFINILSIFIILSHEVFAFFALPVLYILLFNQFRVKGILQSSVLSFLCLLPSICTFGLTLLYHGDYQIVQAILDSWATVLGKEILTTDNSIGAIGWQGGQALTFHFKKNFLYTDQNIFSSLVWLITFPVVYYIATNVLFVFRKNDTDFSNKHKTALSSILIFQLLCLLPIFIGLSCDYIRVSFYWVASSFAIFLIISINKIEEIFPSVFVRFVERINECLSAILHPTKTTLVFLMMFIGISGKYCIVGWAYRNSLIFNVLYILSKPLILIKDIVFNILN